MSRDWGTKQHAAGCEPTALNHEEHRGDSNSRALGDLTKGGDPLTTTALGICAGIVSQLDHTPADYIMLAALIEWAPYLEFVPTPEAKRYRYIARIAEGALRLRRPTAKQNGEAFVRRCWQRREAVERARGI